MTASEGDIGRENLERHRIIYDEQTYLSDDSNATPEDRLPDHVDALREALLSLSSVIPDDWKETFDKELEHYGDAIIGLIEHLQPPESAYFTPPRYELRNPSQQSITAHENNEKCKKIAEAARNRAKEAEAGWTAFHRKHIFGDFDEEDHSRTEIDLLFNQWSLQENYQWTDFKSWEEAPANLKRRTEPKPDLTYGFPIISSTKGLPKGFVRDEYVQCFSLDVLGKLRSNGVCSATTTGLQKWNKHKNESKLKATDLLCFPWAVVETKHMLVSAAEVEKCYCQAANASAAALSLRQELVTLAFGAIPETLSPIIAFTCIGPRIKVWLTYRIEQDGNLISKMSCIWSTTLELTWGVIVIRHIVQAMHFWSSRILKSKIAAAVSQLRVKLNAIVTIPIRTPRSQRFLSVSTPPRSTSSHNRSRSRTKSPCVRSHKSREESIDDATLVDSSTESSGILDDSNEGEQNTSDSDDGTDKSTVSESEDVAFVDQILSSDDESTYPSPETSDIELEDQSSSDTDNGSPKRRVRFKYAEEELQERRRTALTILPAWSFAELDGIRDWFDNLNMKYKVKTIWSLIDTSNGGLQIYTHDKWKKNKLEGFVVVLNEALDHDESDNLFLTAPKLGQKKTGGTVRRGIRALHDQPSLLWDCFKTCLSLYDDKNDKRKNVFAIIREDFVRLTESELKQMEEHAFELLNEDDQKSNLLP